MPGVGTEDGSALDLSGDLGESSISPGSSSTANMCRHTFSFLNKIHTAEVFPLVLSTAIVMQGLIFIGIQGTGLQDIIVGGCKAASQIVWPGR